MKKKLITAIVLVGILATPSANAVSLTAAQKGKLQYLVEEEKLARDVYGYFSTKVTTQRFSNIVKSEQTHMDQISNLLDSYKISNPTVGKAAGEFKNKSLANLYKKLISDGSSSTPAAFGVGVKIEKMDLADLKSIRKLFSQSDILAGLDLLEKGSQNHLAAFIR